MTLLLEAHYVPLSQCEEHVLGDPLNVKWPTTTQTINNSNRAVSNVLYTSASYDGIANLSTQTI